MPGRGRRPSPASRGPDARPAWQGRNRSGDVITYAVLIVGGLTMLAPFIWMVSTSPKSPGEVFKFPPVWIPDPPMWSNYAEIFEVLPFPLSLAVLNSLKITVLEVLGAVFSASLAAFAFARLRFRGSNVWFTIFLATMMVPGAVTLIPVTAAILSSA